jgi:glycosyltransferase involved in cell wall biosynthesis
MRLSVCIITYNHEQFIEQCIRSVLEQDVNFDYDVVVGDDCSTDSTASILAKLESENPNRLKVIYNKTNIGGQLNLKQTLAACKGEFIAFLEGDDYWTSTQKLQLQVDFLDKHIQASGVFHRTRAVDVTDPSRKYFLPGPDTPEFCSFDFLFQFHYGNPIAVGSLVARHASLADIDTWLAGVKPGDWLIGMMLATKGPIGFIPLEMSHYRLHAAGHWQRLNPHSQFARVIHMLQHVSGLVHDANKELVDQRLDTLTRWWSHDVVVNGAVNFEDTIQELDKIGDVRLSNYLLAKVVSDAKKVDQEKYAQFFAKLPWSIELEVAKLLCSLGLSRDGEFLWNRAMARKKKIKS